MTCQFFFAFKMHTTRECWAQWVRRWEWLCRWFKLRSRRSWSPELSPEFPIPKLTEVVRLVTWIRIPELSGRYDLPRDARQLEISVCHHARTCWFRTLSSFLLTITTSLPRCQTSFWHCSSLKVSLFHNNIIASSICTIEMNKWISHERNRKQKMFSNVGKIS